MISRYSWLLSIAAILLLSFDACAQTGAQGEKETAQVLTVASNCGAGAYKELRRLSVEAQDAKARKVAHFIAASWDKKADCYLAETPELVEAVKVPKEDVRRVAPALQDSMAIPVRVRADASGRPFAVSVLRGSGISALDRLLESFLRQQTYAPRRTTKGFEPGEVVVTVLLEPSR